MTRTHIPQVIALMALGATLSIGVSNAREIPTTADASIAFANHGGIYDWRADGNQGMWIQDRHRQWYYAKFMGFCSGLPFANTVGFATGPGGDLDRWSYVRVRDSGRCYFQSFDRSSGPLLNAKPKK